MDPLSSVSSIIAVVSLALQIRQSAFDIKQFFDTIRNAPEEIIRLKGVVLQVHFIAEGIKTVLERQNKAHPQNNHMHSNIHHALETCQKKLILIEDVFHIAKKVNNGQSSLSRNWAQFRLACRREQIEEFERQLHQAVSFLNINLLLNLMDSNLMLGLEFRSTAQQLSTGQEKIPVNHCFLYTSSHGLQGISDNRVIPTIPDLPRTSVYKARSKEDLFQIQRYKTSDKHKRPSILLQARISKSYVITVRLSRPIFSKECSIPFNISIQNLIPADAAILKACEIGDSDQVKRLLQLGTAGPNDMTSDNHTPLSVAVKRGHEEVVQLLLREGADPNLPCGNFQISPLQIGMYFEKLGIVRILIQQGADLEYNSTQGWSLLHYLFDEHKPIRNPEYYSILRGCLSFDDIKDKEGWTALHRCAAFGTAEDVRFLYLLGASACSNRYTTKRGWSPIHVASLTNNVSTLEALANLQATHELSQGYRNFLDCVDIHGWTPLHYAAHRGAIDAVKWLICNGADPHRTTYPTADWFPEGHEGEAFEVSDLIMLSQNHCLEAFLGALEEAGYDVTVDGEDIYWLMDS